MFRILALSLFFAASSVARAQEDLPAPVKFGDGEFTFARGEDEEIAVSYNGIEIYRNFYVSFNQIVKVEGEEVALLSGGDGGNACGPAQIVVTLPEDQPDPKVEIIGKYCGAPEPALSRDRLVFAPSYVAPGAAEPFYVWTPAAGLRRMGELRFLPQPDTNWANFDAAKVSHPTGLFDNNDVHDAAVNLLGDKFSKVVSGLSVAGPPEVIGGKFVASSGCQPHACGSANAFLGIDIEKRAVFAASRTGDLPEAFWPADFSAWPAQLQTAYEKSKTE